MASVLLFLGGFFTGVFFTLVCGYYLSTKIDDIENRKL